MAADSSGITIINNHIKNGSYSNIYLMSGNEAYLLYQYRDKLLENITDVTDSMNYCAFKNENAKVDAISEFALTMPFFAERRVLLVENSGFFKKGSEDMESTLNELPDTTIIVFVEEEIDKRNKLFKLVSSEGCVVTFDTPDEKTLCTWIKSMFSREQYMIEDMAIFRLLEGVGMDMCTLANEVEKLKCYCYDTKQIRISDIEALSVNQVEGKIFDMMDALSRRDKKKTMDLYNDLLLLREPAMRILFLITRQFNILLKTKLALSEGYNPGQIAAVVKIPPFTVKKYIGQCNGYTYDELIKKVNRCQDADTHIKTGKYSDKMSVELLIVELLQ